jgi:hypothetical protein
MASFKASVQYGDWKGTSAADDSDPLSLSVSRYLEKKGLIKPDEFLLAVQLFVGETHNNKPKKPYIRAYLLKDAKNHDAVRERLEELESAGEPSPVREVRIDMTLGKFVAMFKRFEVMLTWDDLPLTEREYRVTEED